MGVESVPMGDMIAFIVLVCIPLAIGSIFPTVDITKETNDLRGIRKVRGHERDKVDLWMSGILFVASILITSSLYWSDDGWGEITKAPLTLLATMYIPCFLMALFFWLYQWKLERAEKLQT